MHRQPSSFSETEVVTDSENVSESNTDGFSDGNTDNPANDFDILRVRDSSSQHQFINKNGATEKIATVCNEIKQRFQPDLTNTDDENVIWDLQIYIRRYICRFNSNIYIAAIAEILAAAFSKRSVAQSGHNRWILIVTTTICTCMKPSGDVQINSRNRTLPYPFWTEKKDTLENPFPWEKFYNQCLFLIKGIFHGGWCYIHHLIYEPWYSLVSIVWQ